VRTFRLDRYRDALRSLMDRSAGGLVKAAFDFRREEGT
jgi:hypothetical protein